MSDNGLYSVTDGTLDKTFVFFVPNNTTPDNIYYSSSSATVEGGGSFKITGSFDYMYDVEFTNNIGTGGNTGTFNYTSSSAFVY